MKILQLLIIFIAGISQAKTVELITCKIESQVISSEDTLGKIKVVPLDKKIHGSDAYQLAISKLNTNKIYTKGLMPGWVEGSFSEVSSIDNMNNERWFVGQPGSAFNVLHLVSNANKDWEVYITYMRSRVTDSIGKNDHNDTTYFGKCY
ncbi:MAG: hypothetical protein H7281_17845 [Bacteriovorax sp.]|nr:hypothetical protein [Bacteriovorax sp.]